MAAEMHNKAIVSRQTNIEVQLVSYATDMTYPVNG